MNQHSDATRDPSPGGAVEDRLARIEGRLAAIEQRLAMQPDPGAAAPPPQAAARSAGQSPHDDLPFAAAVPPQAVWSARRVTPPPLPKPPAAAAPQQLPYAAPAPAAPAGVKQGSLEQTIGLKWAGWVGAVILVIALGLGIKYGYDQGWFGGVPATVRLVLCWAASFALIGAGEWVYRRVNKLSAVGLFGAGVASLFVVSYAGHGYFDVYTRGAAFVLMAASTVVGMLVAMRGRLASIGVLSLVGGNLAPLLLGGDDPNLAAFLGYLLTLEVTALALSLWGGTARWWTLRGLSLVTTAFWSVVALAEVAREAGVDPRGWPLGFVLLFAGLYQAEVILSAWLRRDATAKGRTGAAFSVVVTAFLAAGLVAIFHASADATRGAVVAAVAAGCAALGFACRGLALARERSAGGAAAAATDHSARALHALAIGFAVQSAVLLVVAVPIAFSGWAVMAGWTALAVAFAGIGSALDLRVPRRAAVVTWSLGVAYFAWWVAAHWRDGWRAWFNLLETPVPEYLGVAVIVAAAGHLIAAVVRMRHSDESADREFDAWGTLAQALAGVLWAGASIAALPPAGATLSILLYAWLCAAGDLLAPRRMNLAWHAAGAVAVACVKWAAVDVVAQRLAPDWSPGSAKVLLNPTMAVGAAIAATVLGLWWTRRDRWSADLQAGSRATWLSTLVGVVIVMMTVGLSVEVDRAVSQAADRAAAVPAMPWAQVRMLSWTMLWTAAAGALAGSIRLIRGEPGMRTAAGVGVALGLLLAAKFVAADTLGFRLVGRPAGVTLGANLQVVVGVVVTLFVVLAYWMGRRGDPDRPAAGWLPIVGMAAAVLPLWIGSLEIDRWAVRQTIAPNGVARHAGWSVFWSAYAIGLVVAGFAWRTRAMRYFGLGLFALTLAKVVLVDLSGASTGLRILSFFGLGVLLLATSVVYGKVSPRLLDTPDDDGSNGLPPGAAGVAAEAGRTAGSP